MDGLSAGKFNGLEEIASEKVSPDSNCGGSDGLGKNAFEKETPSFSDGSEEITLEKEARTKETKAEKTQTWPQMRPALGAIEYMMSFRVKKRIYPLKNEQYAGSGGRLAPIGEPKSVKGASEINSEEEFNDAEKLDLIQDASFSGSVNASAAAKTSGNGASHEPFFPGKEELESLVRRGVPKALRGEVQ